MNPISRQIIWNSLVKKLESDQPLNSTDFVWDIMTNSGTVSKDDFLGNPKVLEERIAKHSDILKMSEEDFRAKYDADMKILKEQIEQETAFRNKFETEAKRVLAEIRATKIITMKKIASQLLNEFLLKLDNEIASLKANLIPYETWKRDTISVASSQVPYLKNLLKDVQKQSKEGQKLIDLVVASFPKDVKW